MPMELTFECPSCDTVGRVAEVESVDRLSCPSCGWNRQVADGAIREGGLAACAACSTVDFYIQKDFPHGLGLSIVLVGFALSTVFWFYYMPVASMAVLLASAALDVVLYYLVPDVTICYRCLGQYRGPGANPGDVLRPFDLAIGERYRQERLRVEELRRLGRSAAVAGSGPSSKGEGDGRG